MKPILFSTPMVQAIMDGRKMQTRQVVTLPKNAPEGRIPFFEDIPEPGLGVHAFWQVKPKYKVRDILYVRETWLKNHRCLECRYINTNSEYLYRASDEKPIIISQQCAYNCHLWNPSTHMPKEAARLFLEVKSVRLERLRSISLGDKLAEGFCDCSRAYPCDEKKICDKHCFMKSWHTLNAKRGYGWDVNPWVWVYEFERTEVPNA